MKRPIHKASLADLLCIVQAGSACIDRNGKWMSPCEPTDEEDFVTDDQAEAEITRRDKAKDAKIRRLQRHIKRLEGE